MTGVQVLRTREELAELRVEWNQLAAADSRDGLFRAYAWNALWLRHIAPTAQPRVITVRDEHRTLIGLAPMCETVYRDRAFRIPSIGFTGREVVAGDFLDVLAAPGREGEVLDVVLPHIETALAGRPLLVLGEMLEGCLTARHVMARVGAKGWRSRWQERRTCPFIELPASFDEYLRTLSGNMRSNLRRRTRQVLEEQGCEIDRCRGSEAVLEAFPELQRLHAARWGDGGSFALPGFRQFLEAFVAAHPTTELYVLRHEGKAVAVQLYFRWGHAALFYQGGWDPASAVARLSPSMVLFGRAIADAIDDRCRYFDFLQGDEAYKLNYTRTVRTTATLLVAGRGLSTRFYFAFARARDRAKRLLRRG